MAHLRKRAEADDGGGAPEWMLTFSDCMTLLLTFFVLLLSFSSFDEEAFHKLKSIFGGGMPSMRAELAEKKDAFLPANQIMHTADLDAGSEKPTLTTGTEDNLKEETEPEDFRSRKVFLVPSKRVFWGNGKVISLQGRRTLAAIASYLKEAPNRIVISESAPDAADSSKDSGLPRAWAVLDYLTAKKDLDKKWFSLSASNTVYREKPGGDERSRSETEAERVLEIVLLERSIYN
ncbi:MAG: flagellar motor protein MotB [Planctomycetota bacterium]|jgi:chemotaxis protein MotB